MRLGHELWEEGHRGEVAFPAHDIASGHMPWTWLIAAGVDFDHLAEVCPSGCNLTPPLSVLSSPHPASCRAGTGLDRFGVETCLFPLFTDSAVRAHSRGRVDIHAASGLHGTRFILLLQSPQLWPPGAFDTPSSVQVFLR